MGCRRCMTIGTYIPERRHYYYDKFGKKYRSRPAPRTAEYTIEHGNRFDNAATDAEKSEIRLATGVCGLSVLFQLYILYEFDPVKDFVIDRMHLSFNTLKKEFLTYMWIDMGDNGAREINQRHPSDGGLISRNQFKESLEHVNWTKQQRAAGVPNSKSLTDRLGGWKANEYLKLCHVASGVLAEIVPSKAYDCFMLACEFIQMLYSRYLMNYGWRNEDIEKLEAIIWTHNIRAEEFYGAQYCSENVEYSAHMGEVLKRHSSADNYSCEMFERIIRSHKRQSTNSKNVEPTYVERESIRQFICKYEREHGPLSMNANDPSYVFVAEEFNNPEIPVMMREKSVASACKLLKDLKSMDIHDGIQHAVNGGVIVGSLKRRDLSANQKEELRRLTRCINREERIEINVRGNFASKIIKWNTSGEIEEFSVGDQCIVGSREDEAEEWLLTISAFVLFGPVAGKYYIAVDGNFFVPGWNGRILAVHPWTRTTQFVQRHYARDRLQLTSQLKRKVILYPEPSNLGNPSFYLCIDFNKKDFMEVSVPFYPEADEYIKVQGGNQQVWYAKVIQSDHARHKARVLWFDERQPGQLFLLQQEANISYSSIIGQAALRRRLWYYEII